MSELRVGWQAGPTERGTLTLIYSCLITIFACTWTVLHLNVPGLYDKPLTIVLRKAKWMVITILLPEFVFSKAICDLRLALDNLRQFDAELKTKWKNADEWTDRISFSEERIRNIWMWKVDFGPRPNLLYRLLGLQPPVICTKTSGETLEFEDSDYGADNNPGGGGASVERLSTETPTQALDETIEHRHSLSPAQTSNPESKTPFHEYHIVQNWTLTHAYLANMGGLVYMNKPEFPDEELPRYILSGAMLSHRYHWETTHPLHGLVLSKEDISDKSKADWLLRSITVLQVIWLVLTVLVRAIEGLAVSQLEVATVAFSLCAIATYAANWWKPKDITRPITVPHRLSGRNLSGLRKSSQAFAQFLIYPRRSSQKVLNITEDNRIRNDITRMEEGVPLIISIMAVSALVFGGLHCLAWNFEFPSQAERTLWRVSSLTSMMLPTFSLALNLLLNYMITTHSTKKLIAFILERLKPLKALPENFWESLKNPHFESWQKAEKFDLIFRPTGSRDFDKKPAGVVEREWDQDTRCAQFLQDYIRVTLVGEFVRDFVTSWESANQGDWSEHVLRSMISNLELMQKYNSSTVLEFWNEFEDFLEEKLLGNVNTRLRLRCIQRFFALHKECQEEEYRIGRQRDIYQQLCQALVYTTGIAYIASRLIILVLLFTSLRAAPEGIYKNTPWTRYLPNFS